MRYILGIYLLLFPCGVFAQIQISEVVSNPETGSEWVELHNLYDSDFILSSWKLIEGAGKEVILNQTIEANKYGVFEVKGLNNSGDTVLLYDPCGQLIDQISYGNFDDGNVQDNVKAPKKGESIIRNGSVFRITSELTKGEKNPVSKESSTYAEILPILLSNLHTDEVAQIVKQSESIQEIKKKEKGDEVHVVGVATTDIGIIDERVFYLQKEDEGIQIFVSSRIKEDIEVLKGHLLQVTGKLSEATGEKKINVSKKEDIVILGNGETPFAKDVRISELKEEYVGSLIAVKGTLEYKNRSYSLVNEGDIKIKGTIDLKEYEHKELLLTGILKGSRDNFSLHIRDENDIQEVVKEKQEFEKSQKESVSFVHEKRSYIWLYILWGMVVFFSVLAILFYKYPHLFTFWVKESDDLKN